MSLWGENSIWAAIGGFVINLLARAMRAAIEELKNCPAESSGTCPLRDKTDGN